MSYAKNMAVVVRVKRRFANVPAEGLVVFKHTTDTDTFTNPIVPVIAKLVSTVNSVEDNIARYLSIALKKKEVKDKLKQDTYHDVLVRACQEAKGDSQYWRYQLAAEGYIHHLDTGDLVEFKKKAIILMDAEDLHPLRNDYLINNDLESMESIDCVYDIYYSETNTIRKEDTISLHPVFKHELKLHTHKEHKWLNKFRDGDYDTSFTINTIQEIIIPLAKQPCLDGAISQLTGFSPAILFSPIAYALRDSTPGIPLHVLYGSCDSDPPAPSNDVPREMVMQHGPMVHGPDGEPSDQPAGQLADQPADQPAGQPVDQPDDQPDDQPADQSADQPVGQLADQPDGQPMSQPPVQPADQSADQPVGQPVGQLADQPAD